MDSERNDARCRTREAGESSELMTVETARFLDEAGGGTEDGRRQGRKVAGRAGRVVEGAGFGEGMLRNDSFDVRRRVDTTGTVGGVITIGCSARLRERENIV